MPTANARRSTVKDQLNGATNRNGMPPVPEAPPVNLPMQQPQQSLEDMMHAMQQQLMVTQMQLQQQMATYDLQAGNHDLVVGVQAIGGLAQSLPSIAPFLNPIIGDMAELCITKDGDYSFIDIEIGITNEDE